MQKRNRILWFLFQHSEAVPIISSTGTDSGEQKLCGFGIDLLDLICSKTRLEYRVQFVKDGMTGKLIDPAKSTWTGMMGEVVHQVRGHMDVEK